MKQEVEKSVPKEAAELLAMHQSTDENVIDNQDDTLEEDNDNNKSANSHPVTSIQETPNISINVGIYFY